MKIKQLGVLAFLITVLMPGCWLFSSPEDRGPIIIDNKIQPDTLINGLYANWTITAENKGEQVLVSKIHVQETFLYPDSGKVISDYDVPLTDSIIIRGQDPGQLVYSNAFMAINTTDSVERILNWVTVYSDGGNDSDTCSYTIYPSGKSSTKP